MSAHQGAGGVAWPSGRGRWRAFAARPPTLGRPSDGPLGEFWKDSEDGLEVGIEAVAVGTLKRSHPEVFNNRELGENLSPFGDQRDPQPDAIGRWESLDRLRPETDHAARAVLQTNKRAQRRRLDGRIRADERRHFAGFDTQGHIAQDVDLTVVHVDAAKLEHAGGPDTLRQRGDAGEPLPALLQR